MHLLSMIVNKFKQKKKEGKKTGKREVYFDIKKNVAVSNLFSVDFWWDRNDASIRYDFKEAFNSGILKKDVRKKKETFTSHRIQHQVSNTSVGVCNTFNTISYNIINSCVWICGSHLQHWSSLEQRFS